MDEFLKRFIHERKLIKVTQKLDSEHCPPAPPGHVFLGEFEDPELGCICIYHRTEPPEGILIIPCLPH